MPGGTAPGTAVAYRLLIAVGVPGSTRRLRPGHPGGGLGRRPELPLLVGPARLDPAHTATTPSTASRPSPGWSSSASSPAPCSCSPGASARPSSGSHRLAEPPALRRRRHASPSLVQKVADRLRGPAARPPAAAPRRALGGRQLAPRRRLAVGVHRWPSATSSRPSTCWWPTAWPTSWPSSPSPPAGSAWSRASSSPPWSASASPATGHPRRPRPTGWSTSGCPSPWAASPTCRCASGRLAPAPAQRPRRVVETRGRRRRGRSAAEAVARG